MIEIGQFLTKKFIVKEVDLASNIGSGDLPVLATPVLLNFFENTCKELLSLYLTEEDTSVGIFASFDHVAPSKQGDVICINVKVINIEKRVVSFSIEAFDGDKLISSGNHKRCIVNKERFLTKLQ